MIDGRWVIKVGRCTTLYLPCLSPTSRRRGLVIGCNSVTSSSLRSIRKEQLLWLSLGNVRILVKILYFALLCSFTCHRNALNVLSPSFFHFIHSFLTALVCFHFYADLRYLIKLRTYIPKGRGIKYIRRPQNCTSRLHINTSIGSGQALSVAWGIHKKV